MNKLTKKELKEQRKAEKEEERLRLAKREKRKQIALWGGFAALILLSVGAIFFLLTRPGKQEPAVSENVNSSLPPVTKQDYRNGPANAKVTLIEYGDFQCPACGHYFPMISKLKKDYKGRVQFVFRNFPLPTVHKNAEAAAYAAFAAGKQGKFWEMHDVLYNNQAKWSEVDNTDELFTMYATEIKLDPIEFTTDMMSDEAKLFIKSQSDGGTKAGVAGTPTFYMNGRQLTNPSTYDEFKKLVDTELASGK